eukprot:TRINITY_DN8418_c0_g1_i1.p1 TRINITY_DN8418_c0_g1~~TRINITY_DN8418_c0_g1_i1.p1  ORF type:complete len:446 (+),score=111.83 TRINITY_DN8418_c0_g1_i1:497-1834(+)
MFNRFGLDRFKKAQSMEPFSVSANAASKASAPMQQAYSNPSPVTPFQHQQHQALSQHKLHSGTSRTSSGETASANAPNCQATGIGAGQSSWQPPEWAVEPRPGVFRLEVVKDGEVLDQINLDKRRHIFGRQAATCDFVLDHPSISRQHAAVVQHRNGSIYVIDLGSIHGTFVANERLSKDSPVELEVGQSLRFAASSRSYILRKNPMSIQPFRNIPSDISLPPPPDPSDEEAVVAYNTLLNRFGASRLDLQPKATECVAMASASDKDGEAREERDSKRRRKARVAFRDEHGGELVEIVGISDGADVSTEPGPIGVKEGSLVGKYESLVQVTVIPKGQGSKDQLTSKEETDVPKGVTEKLQQYLNKAKHPTKSGFYEDLYGDSFASHVGGSWANATKGNDGGTENILSNTEQLARAEPKTTQTSINQSQSSKTDAAFDDDDDLFGD